MPATTTNPKIATVRCAQPGSKEEVIVQPEQEKSHPSKAKIQKLIPIREED